MARSNGRDDPYSDFDQTRQQEPLVVVDPVSLLGTTAPPRQWLVRDWIPMFRVTAIYGAGGEGKTLLGQMLATACAIDKPWLGLKTRQCNSVLLYCEDDLDEMHRRQQDINQLYGCGFEDLGAMKWVPRLGHDNALATFHDGRTLRSYLFDQLLAAGKAHEAQLVVTDTLADVFAGNENDRAQARAFSQGVLGLLARELKSAVLVFGHPSRAGINTGSGESGSTAWLGTFRSQIYLSTPKADDGAVSDPDARELTRKKANAARRDDTIELRWKDGVFITPTMSTSASGIVGSIMRRGAREVFLHLLDAVIAEGRHVSESPHARNYAPKLFAQRPEREGFRQADFKRAMEELYSQKVIANDTYKGPNRYKYECIVRASQAVHAVAAN
jgi:RecA-family ATPase